MSINNFTDEAAFNNISRLINHTKTELARLNTELESCKPKMILIIEGGSPISEFLPITEFEGTLQKIAKIKSAVELLESKLNDAVRQEIFKRLIKPVAESIALLRRTCVIYSEAHRAMSS